MIEEVGPDCAHSTALLKSLPKVDTDSSIGCWCHEVVAEVAGRHLGSKAHADDTESLTFVFYHITCISDVSC